MILRLAHKEASIPYETVLVDRSKNAQTSPEYPALNPAGKIPALLTPEGTMAETAARLLWLSDAYPEAGLCPAPGAPHRGAHLRWLLSLSNTLHAEMIRVFYPDRVVPKESVAALGRALSARR
ncbi:MAG: glutathione S-transferase N-terminal domain-containing protein [Pseudomonadota bacterium]